MVGDRTSVQTGFLVPIAALVYITWVAFDEPLERRGCRACLITPRITGSC